MAAGDEEGEEGEVQGGVHEAAREGVGPHVVDGDHRRLPLPAQPQGRRRTHLQAPPPGLRCESVKWMRCKLDTQPQRQLGTQNH